MSVRRNQVSPKILCSALCLVGAMLFALCSVVQAQQPKKVARIGYLSGQSLAAEASRVSALRKGLSDLGYSEGKDVVIEYRFAEGKLDRFPRFAAELARLGVDVIVTGGSPGTHAEQQATKTIPLVMTLVGDPVPRFVASLAKPDGNITGLTQISPQLSGKE